MRGKHGQHYGNTLAQNLAPISVLIIRLGTNDETVTVGTLGDAPTAGTLYGNMGWVISTLLTAKPTLRILMVSPQLNGGGSSSQIQALVNAEIAIANYYAIPILNEFATSGNNPQTTGTYTRDGTHPSDWAFNNVDGPMIAEFVKHWF